MYKRYTPADNLRGVMAKPQKKKVVSTVLPPPPESVVTGESMVGDMWWLRLSLC